MTFFQVVKEYPDGETHEAFFEQEEHATEYAWSNARRTSADLVVYACTFGYDKTRRECLRAKGER